jgi:hypothetical protein
MDAIWSVLNEYKLYFAIGAVLAGAIWAWIRLRKPERSVELRQSSGAQSTNLQAGRDITVTTEKSRK